MLKTIFFNKQRCPRESMKNQVIQIKVEEKLSKGKWYECYKNQKIDSKDNQ